MGVLCKFCRMCVWVLCTFSSGWRHVCATFIEWGFCKLSRCDSGGVVQIF